MKRLPNLWVVNAAVAIRAIWAGASVASREFTSPTWESLVLTGIGVRRLYFGNWRAALRIAAPWMFALGAVRLAMLPLSMLGITTRFAGYIVSAFGPPSTYQPYPESYVFFSWIPWAAVTAVIAAVLLTVLEILLCTALGVTLAFLTRNNIAAILTAAVLRLMPLVVSAMQALLDGTLDFRNPYAIFTHAAMSMADLGTSAISRLAAPYMLWSVTTHISALYGLMLAFVLGITLLVGAVIGGLVSIRLSGARTLPKQAGQVAVFRLAR
ncbi:MAG: hypothetical protein KF716_19185 [Anaerolineae bacterium]|nr:hypothetical protein [Anaerolineae bacterium]